MLLKNNALKLLKIENFKELSSVQEKVYPLAISRKKNLLVNAPTGSGKTHAFLLPIIDLIDVNQNRTQVLILLPTRELAYQVFEFSKSMTNVINDLRIDLIVGGQERVLKTTKMLPHIVIGTSGRIWDLFSKGYLRLDQVDTLVIDEADMIWEFGFLDEVLAILDNMNPKVFTMAFSATYPVMLEQILKKKLKPQVITSSQDNKFDPNVRHILIEKKHLDYGDLIIKLFSKINYAGCIIFANKKEEVVKIAEKLRQSGYKLLEMHSDLDARRRKQIFRQINDVEYPLIVASDILARGIDLPYVSHIISCGFPIELNYYLHRAGRTGRNGRSGTCYCFVSEKDRSAISQLQNQGINFVFQKFSQDSLKEVSHFYVHKKKNVIDTEISRLNNKKKAKIKPNYKKKHNALIESIKRKKRREMIKESIKQQQKERAKLKALKAKRSYE